MEFYIKIKNYILKKSLGKGSFGEVYLAEDEGHQKYAIKRLCKRNYRMEHEIKQLKSEIEFTKSLKHDNILKLIDLIPSENNYYLVFQYCNGKTLIDLIKTHEVQNIQIPTSIIQKFAIQIASALNHLKNFQIIHRDIKPDNIGIHFEIEEDINFTTYQNCKFILLDFGVSRQGLGQSIKGTPLYAEPSMLNNFPYKQLLSPHIHDEKFDIWSLGIVLYELAFLRHPFLFGTYEDFFKNLKNGNYLIPKNVKISEELIDLISKCLKFDSKIRIDIEEVLDHPFLKLNLNEFHFNERNDDLVFNSHNNKNVIQQRKAQLNFIQDDLEQIFMKTMEEEGYLGFDNRNS